LNIKNCIDTHNKATELNVKNRIDMYNKATELNIKNRIDTHNKGMEINVKNRIDTHDKATVLNIKNHIDMYNKAMELLLIMLVIYLFNILTYPLCSPKFISYNTEVFDKLSTNRCGIASSCVVGRVNITLCKVMSFVIYLLLFISVYH